MGNYISCTLATPLIKSARAARVVLPRGEIRQFRGSVKAAELMLECPNYFLTNSQSLHIGKRFSALSADEELELGNVFIMFPMKRLNSVVTAADVALFFVAAKSSGKIISSGNINDEESSTEGSKLRLEGVEEFKYRLSVCRSRKPSLETIKEEPVCSRGKRSAVYGSHLQASIVEEVDQKAAARIRLIIF
ncbi:hypothetical protein F3Y22_tig00110864pilonHSYRG00346 [Hibiscus syriacus]|uniref:Uncharacterized protein n=1 Tax=Hibiscus syriacus TaxID=106335 RepID=A0A6A2ZKH4_HIBSY|nr:uncharacterized protein LOC120143896 [Hibiscus syriacus]KAE8691987.1 hypothetical protein F3Y22_tig00110864pilonHSYRG00346 [Hibiscus syriacus]